MLKIIYLFFIGETSTLIHYFSVIIKRNLFFLINQLVNIRRLSLGIKKLVCLVCIFIFCFHFLFSFSENCFHFQKIRILKTYLLKITFIPLSEPHLASLSKLCLAILSELTLESLNTYESKKDNVLEAKEKSVVVSQSKTLIMNTRLHKVGMFTFHKVAGAHTRTCMKVESFCHILNKISLGHKTIHTCPPKHAISLSLITFHSHKITSSLHSFSSSSSSSSSSVTKVLVSLLFLCGVMGMLILVGNVQGTMTSFASPVSLGNLMGVSSSGRGRKRWHLSLDSNSSRSKGGDDGAGFVLKPPPKPVLKSPENKSVGEGRKAWEFEAAPQKSKTLKSDASELNVSIPGAATARKGRKWSKASRRAARLQAARDAAPIKVEILEVGDKGMLVEELAYCLATSEGEILGYLYSKGIKPDGVQTIDKDMVKMICKEYDVEVIDADPFKVEGLVKKREILDEDDFDKLKDRPPVITIMGHVDHGKTTLLDYIRKSKVAASEAGGITQGIGAYKVEVPVDGKKLPCVFLDTPGHEAFGAMRARGASVTDMAIIVVAADDGIRPQTNEAIAHAKAAGVPIIIAINKACQHEIDKDGANPERVMQELSSIGLMPEDWGGDIPMVPISALKGKNIDDLLETVMLVAELQELKANPDRSAKGTVVEAGLDKSKGPFASFIVQNGTLRRGDIVVCGEASGKVRALFDDGGKRVDEASPSMPVQVIGLNNVPIAGDEFEVVESLDTARERAEARAESLRNERISAKAGDGKVTLSSLASAVSSGKLSGLDLHQLNIILKVDLQGSIEAVRKALEILPQDNVTLKFLLEATGDVNTSDVDLSVASKAIILGFNVKAPGSVKSYGENKAVEIRLYRVIYELIDDVRKAMEGLLEPVEEQVTIGSAVVRAVFSSGSGRVAGCMVTEGKILNDCGIRVKRKGKVVHVGILDSLRRVKEIVKEVNAGLECGLGLEDFDDWEEGDILEAFNTFQKKRTLEEASASMASAVEGVGVAL
ncbi:hypothetical protein JHK87_021563 [Glycine soja]|nr:hypothetical protein JHK87_021563 [Glycine soja]